MFWYEGGYFHSFEWKSRKLIPSNQSFVAYMSGFTTCRRKLRNGLEVEEFAAIRSRRGSRDMEMGEVERHLADICLRWGPSGVGNFALSCQTGTLPGAADRSTAAPIHATASGITPPTWGRVVRISSKALAYSGVVNCARGGGVDDFKNGLLNVMIKPWGIISQRY